MTPDRLQMMVMALPAPGAYGYRRPGGGLAWLVQAGVSLSNSFSTNPTCTALRGRRRGSGLRGRLAWRAAGLGYGGTRKVSRFRMAHFKQALQCLKQLIAACFELF